MKLQIIQFSDIHVKTYNNPLIERKIQLFDALKNEINSKTILLVSGDTVFSGKKEEFEIANNFYSELITDLTNYSNQEINIITVPGNHDCENLDVPDKTRKILIDALQSDNSNLDINVINTVAKNQNNYFDFVQDLDKSLSSLHSDVLSSTHIIDLEKYKIVFNCYNTAFQSILHEIPGKMIFPVNLLKNDFIENESSLTIACFHHPLHWFQPEEVRNFRNHIENTADFYFTGHEHVNSESMKSDLKGNFTYYIEGDVLQDSDSKTNSGFNIINIDLAVTKFHIQNYKWNGKMYEESEKKSEIHSYTRGVSLVNNKFSISETFLEVLEDIGASFTHPNIAKVKLSDLFIFPNVEILRTSSTVEEELSIVTSFENIINDLPNERIRLIISGPENIGKSSLLKKIFQHLYKLGKIPVLIDGHAIRSTNPEDFKKLVQKNFTDQYITDIEYFKQLDQNKIIILLDNFDKIKVNTRYKAHLLKNLIDNFPNLIITGNELTTVEDIVADSNIEEDLFSSFSQYEIKEFGHQLRSKLINKWNTLGVEHTLSEEERIKKLHQCESIINTVTGTNFVPCYPFFVLTILQSIEVGNPNNLSASTFGYYYHYLIQKALNSELSQREITEYDNYLSELAFYFFKKEAMDFDGEALAKFDSIYRVNYAISHSLQKIIKNLIKMKILKDSNGVLEFRYIYISYYFTSKFISDHINLKDTKDEIERLIKTLYKGENANILMFLTHHSKDSFLIENLLKQAREIFNKIQPCKLEEDIKKINELGEKIPELVFENRSIDEYRTEENGLKDQQKSQINEYEIIENGNEIDIVAELNMAFKSIEIVGQILKNNYGKIEKATIEDLLEETILLGLRALNVFFKIMEDNSEFIVNQVNSVITEIEKARGKKLDNPKKIEDLSRTTVFGLCNQITYSFIKKMSDSLGTEYLSEIFEKVYDKQNFTSVKLLKVAIRLDHHASFPDSEIKTLSKDFSKNPLATNVLKRLVVNYLYLYPTDHKNKSRILEFLNIPVSTQLRIDTTSKVKK